MRLSRFLPRFSLRSLLLLSLLAASGAALWRNWAPWLLERQFSGDILGISDNSKKVAIREDGQIHIYDWDHPNQIVTLEGDADRSNLTFSPDGRFVAVVGTRGSTLIFTGVEIYDSTTGKIVCSDPTHSRYSRAYFTTDARYVATAHGDWSIDLFEFKDRKLTLIKENPKGDPMKLGPLSFSANGKWIVTCGRDSYARIYDVDTGNFRAVLDGHEDQVDHAAFMNDNRRIITESMKDGTVRIWDNQKDFNQPLILRGYLPAFSPDGSNILMWGEHDKIAMYDSESGRKRCELQTTPGIPAARSLLFSPNGKQIIGLTNGGFCIWESKSGRLDFAQSSRSGGLRNMSELSARFISEDRILSMITRDFMEIWHRRRPEWWWGIAWLPEFWLTAVFAIAIVWSLIRDRRELRKKAEAA